MSALSKWNKLEIKQQEALLLLKKYDVSGQFEFIAGTMGFAKNELPDLDLLMKSVIALAPFIVNKLCNNDDEKKETENRKSFQYQSDFDENGIIYWIGTQKGKYNWINPMDLKEIAVTSSALSVGTHQSIIGREWAEMYTPNAQNQWVCVDVKEYEVKPNYYTLRHGYSVGDAYAMNWRLEGMVRNGTEWEVLRTHCKDDSLKRAERTSSWELKCNKYYSKFRVFQYDGNNRPDNHLCLSGFEIYGTIKY
eukprot:455347_1